MSYEKQTWATGDTITAEKLNHMEDGIAGSYDIVFREEAHLEESNPTLIGHGLSFEEIKERVEAGIPLYGFYFLQSENENLHVDKLTSEILDITDNHCILSFNEGYSSRNVVVYSETVESPIGGVYTYTYDSTTKDYTFTFDHWLD